MDGIVNFVADSPDRLEVISVLCLSHSDRSQTLSETTTHLQQTRKV